MRMADPSVVGSDSIAATAAHYRTAYGVEGQVRTDEVLRANGHDVAIKPLRAEQGGLEACVVPLPDGTYRFVCDDRAAPGEPNDVACVGDPRQFRISFRLAHELAHTALGCMSFGTRRGSHSSSAVEARCDAFAVFFLVERDEAQSVVKKGEGAVQSLARQLNIPPRVIRAAASTTR